MDLKRKLARLAARAPIGHSAELRPSAEERTLDLPFDEVPSDPVREALARKRAVAAPELEAPRDTTPDLDDDAWPFEVREHPEGPLHTRSYRYGSRARHGVVPLARCLDLRPDTLGLLGLDETFARFDPATALFVDTETTGLAGGTGTLAFLIGLGAFTDGHFSIEQVFVPEPGEERAALHHVYERMASASAYVSFNGRSFDLPLLTTRFVLAGLPPAPERPHLDLLHVARRIYGTRLASVRLRAVEEEVLGFQRGDDVPGEEIPGRYQLFVRESARLGMLPVFEHNLHDIAALAALLGELGARAAREESPGRFEPEDQFGLARAALRGGREREAFALAVQVLEQRKAPPSVARDANVLAAALHKKARDPRAERDRLLAALAVAPEDPSVHLRLSRCYERSLGEHSPALEHARRALGAEDPDAHRRRIARLERRVREAARQLRLPWA